MEKFSKKKYDVNFRKEAMKEKRKAQFNTDIDYETKQNIDIFLKENNLSKAEFIRISFKIAKLKKEVGKIISKFHCDNEFSIVVNLGKPIIKKLYNGIIVSLYTFPVLDNEKMLVLKIEFLDNILYFGTANFRLSNIIIKELEKINTAL